MPNVPCQSNVPINEICETKANSDTAKSSEGTGCESVAAVNDDPWFPSVGKRFPSNYLSITKYSSNTCDKTQTFEQNTFVANGNCYPVEARNSFFKATCNPNGGELIICNDAECKDCPGQLNAGSFQQSSQQFTSNQCENGLKMTCVQPNGNSITPPPPGTTPAVSNDAVGNGGFIFIWFILALYFARIIK